jgi:hypothetical protein
MTFARIPRGVGWGGESALPEGPVESLRPLLLGGSRFLQSRGNTAVPSALDSILAGLIAIFLDMNQARS